jgi:hypothetical protein
MARFLSLGLDDGLALLLVLFGTAAAVAADDTPRPTPVTRPAMKQMLEEMKSRHERIPLPDLTDAEKATAAEEPTALLYENRLRALYLPGTELRGYLGFGGTAPKRPSAPPPKVVIEPDPAVTLDYGFKTRLFWIAADPRKLVLATCGEPWSIVVLLLLVPFLVGRRFVSPT